MLKTEDRDGESFGSSTTNALLYSSSTIMPESALSIALEPMSEDVVIALDATATTPLPTIFPVASERMPHGSSAA